MAITASMVKELREKTGAGMMDCKKALTESEGDMDAAIKHLREKSLASATKKSGRIAAEGLVGIEVANGTAAIIELNCETDFVARNDAFQKLTADLAAHACKTEAADLDAMLASEMGGKSITDVLIAAVSSIGEKISLRRFERLTSGVAYGSYSHGGGSIGVLVQLGVADAAKADNASVSLLAKDIAMHIASEAPLARTSDEVDAATIANERDIYKNQALAEGKPEKIVEKIVDGRIKKFLKESVLVEQQFVKDPDLTIGKLIAKLGKELETEITVDAFVRFQVGEGIEKKQDNLADEVAKMTK